jgi:hypothetical protein
VKLVAEAVALDQAGRSVAGVVELAETEQVALLGSLHPVEEVEAVEMRKAELSQYCPPLPYSHAYLQCANAAQSWKCQARRSL